MDNINIMIFDYYLKKYFIMKCVKEKEKKTNKLKDYISQIIIDLKSFANNIRKRKKKKCL